MNNYCFATVITKSNYVACAIRMYQALKHFKSKYPFEILITVDIEDQVKEQFNYWNIPYRTCEKLQFNIPDIYSGLPYGDTLSKFNILTLTDYDYVCFLDSDLIITGNLDFVFNQILPGTNFSIYTRINTSNSLGEIFLAAPSIYIYNKLKNKYNNKGLIEADELLLDSLEKENISVIRLGEVSTDGDFPVIHFSGFIKMWECLREGDIIYNWFYKVPIEDFLDFINKYKTILLDFRYKVSNQIDQIFIAYCDFLKAIDSTKYE